MRGCGNLSCDSVSFLMYEVRSSPQNVGEPEERQRYGKANLLEKYRLDGLAANPVFVII